MCEYCEDTERIYHEDSYMRVYDFGILEVLLDDGHGTSVEFKINHCPMCGRKLENQDGTIRHYA